MSDKTIDTLILIGNGFDMWQGISTSYADFEKYYIDHLSNILNRLHIKAWTIDDEDDSHDQKKILEKAAVRARFLMEQGARDAQHEFDFWNIFGKYIDGAPKIRKKDRKKLEKQLKEVRWKDCQAAIKDVLKDRKSTPEELRKDTPKWHISYHSPDDKARIENVMKRINYGDYELYSSIDSCIEQFKKT